MMLLAHRLKSGFSFNIFNTLRNVKEAVLAPKKHIKAAIESSGNEYSQQTNLTAEGFD
jgi:hypothetical protein